MLSTGRDTDERVDNKDTSNRVYSEGPIKQTAREPVMEWSARVPVRASGKGTDRIHREGVSNAVSAQ